MQSLCAEVCQAIVEIREEDFRQALIDIESEWQFKFAFAAIDGSHLPIKRPTSGTRSNETVP